MYNSAYGLPIIIMELIIESSRADFKEVYIYIYIYMLASTYDFIFIEHAHRVGVQRLKVYNESTGFNSSDVAS